MDITALKLSDKLRQSDEVLATSIGGDPYSSLFTYTKCLLHIKSYLLAQTESDLMQAVEELRELLFCGGDDNREVVGSHPLFGSLVLDVAAQLPQDHPSQERFARLIRELSAKPTLPSNTTNEIWNPSATNADLKDTSLFHYDPKLNADLQFEQHNNLHALLARIDSLDVPIDRSVPIWKLRDALEEDYDDPKHPCNSVASSVRPYKLHKKLSQEEAAIRIRSVFITSASLWIVYDGKKMYDRIALAPSDKALTPDEKVFDTAGPLYGGAVYGRPRWDFWKSGFKRAALGEGVDAKCAEYAKKAVEAMSKLEQKPSPMAEAD